MTSEELERRCALMREKYAQSQNTTGSEAVRPRPPVAATEPLSRRIAATDEFPIHPLVRTTQKLVRGQKPMSDGILCAAHLGGVDVDVSPALWSRALTLLNGLFHKISARGWTIGLREHRTEVCVGKQRIPIRLREALTTMPVPAKDRPNSWDPKTKFVPKGVLQLRILSEYGVVRQFEDSKCSRLEEKLGGFLSAIQERAADCQRRADEAQVRAVFERHEHFEKAREDRQQRELSERERCLLADVDGWHQSRRIREYLVVFTEEFKKCCGPILPNSDAAKWLRWAHEYADGLDPLRG